MGGRFRFTLEALLHRRRRVEEEKQREFAACRRALEDGSRQLERLADSRRRCLERMTRSARAGTTPDVRLLDAIVLSLDSAAASGRERRTALEAACGRARDALIAATRDRRAIEKLKERHLRAFQAEEARRDELELDEANSRSYERARRNRLQAGGVRKCGSVIALTRLNGQPVMLNCDLIESVAQNGETIVTLTTGNVVVVREPMDEIGRKVIEYKRKIYAARPDT
jgi:flagellar export protein FliJ